MPTINQGGDGAQQRSMPPNDALHTLQDDAKALFDTAREQGTEHLDEYRQRAADEIENLARSATSAAEQLQDKDTLGLSHYITDVADSLGSFAGSLRGKSADELLHQVSRLARDNPALFLTGSIALGFGLSRFMRASTPDLAQPSSPDSTARSADAEDDAFDPRIAADEELAVRPPHTDDVIRSQSVPPGWSMSSAPAADSDHEPGIQQSGAEMGSFEDHNDRDASHARPDETSTDKPANKGEL
ncbi:hypothetical protein [Pseudomonas sp. NFR16]|uniref:hypothetical protein n=1 Tax=Pseudomonas sp. NFR16 TaxID=1566248 RepID=UPI0008C3E15C|nr:hypothetical protein [Pseudomonas sp. NFR16]SEJ79299.1 hypothetical protein SAMN03159495_4568 [Pseudomonas sp. NFR16]